MAFVARGLLVGAVASLVAIAGVGYTQDAGKTGGPDLNDPLLQHTGEGYEHLLEHEPPPRPPVNRVDIPKRPPEDEVDREKVQEAKKWAVNLLEDHISRLSEELVSFEERGEEKEAHRTRLRIGRLQQVLDKRLAELSQYK